MLTGAVMAGGRSGRMGRDKAALVVAGETLLRRQLRVLREAGARRLVVSCRAAQTVEFVLGVDLVVDTMPDAGPLAGLHAVLADCASPHLAVLAVDMPLVDAAWFVRLRGLCAPGVGAIARTAAGYEPLAAIYPVEAVALAEAHLRQGELSLQSLAAALARAGELRELPAGPADAARLASWNRPGDIAGATDG